MKIGYLTNVYPAVSHSFIKREILALEAAGVEVVRWSIRPAAINLPDPQDRAEAHKTKVILQGGLALALATIEAAARSPAAALRAWRVAMRSRCSGFRSFVRAAAYFVEACLVTKLTRREGLDHLHVHFGTNPTTVARLARILGGAPFSFTVHGPDEFDDPVDLFLGEKVIEAEFAVAISDFGRSQLLRWTPLAHWAKIRVIRCGVDENYLGAFAPDPRPSETRQFCCVARLSPQKGLPVLIEASRLLKESGENFRVVILGDGPLKLALESEIGACQLTGHVELRGWASGDAVRDLLLESRAFVLPSFAEGLPVVIMEALAMARPVISTRIAGIPELVDATCGWVVSPGSAQELFAAMRDALRAPDDKLRAMGEVGRARVAGQHDATKNALALLAQISEARSGTAT